MTPRIHLIEKLNNIEPVAGRIRESGYWSVSRDTADKLIGGDIYFHKTKKEPSF